MSHSLWCRQENSNKIKTEERQTHRSCQNETHTSLHLTAFLLWTHLIIFEDFRKLHFPLILGYFHFPPNVQSVLSAFQTSEGNHLNFFAFSHPLCLRDWLHKCCCHECIRRYYMFGICWVKHTEDNSNFMFRICPQEHPRGWDLFCTRVNRHVSRCGLVILIFLQLCSSLHSL